MKKTDLAMVALIAIASVMIAFFITRAFLGGSATTTVRVKSIESIDATITEPDTAIFNSKAINPAVEVQITPSGE